MPVDTSALYHAGSRGTQRSSDSLASLRGFSSGARRAHCHAHRGDRTLALWAVAIIDRADARWSMAVRVVGYAALAATVIVGATRLISDVRAIV